MDFWNTLVFDEQEQPCLYYLGNFMSPQHFEQITIHIHSREQANFLGSILGG